MRVHPTEQEIQSALIARELQKKICMRSCAQLVSSAMKNYEEYNYATTVKDGVAWSVACESVW